MVVAIDRKPWPGTVMLAPRRSHAAMAALAPAAVGLLGPPMCASYTRTARVGGVLVSGPGLVRVFAPQPGVLGPVNVREGDRIARGTPLLALSAEPQTEALGDTREAVVRRLRGRRDSLFSVRRGQERLQARPTESPTERLAAVEAAQAHLDQE